MTLFSAQRFSYLEMGGCRHLDKFAGKLPSFTAAYISSPVSSGEYCFVTCYIRMSIPVFPSALGCQNEMSGGWYGWWWLSRSLSILGLTKDSR